MIRPARYATLVKLLFLVPFLSLRPAYAQVPTGTPPFGSFAGGPDIIDLANLNSHITVPVLHKPGRGMNLNYDLSYDTSVWYPVTSGATTSWQPVTNFGWTSSTAAVAGYLSYTAVYDRSCPYMVSQYASPAYYLTTTYYYWIFNDDLGTAHTFPGSSTTWRGTGTGSCGGSGSTSLNSTATDGSGYTLSANGSSGSVYDSKGKLVGPPINQFAGPGTLTDRNGNLISIDSSGNITDTLGTVALTVAGSATPSSPATFTYTAPSGAADSYTMKYTAYTVQTKFGCGGISEYGPTSNNLVSEIDLPDGSKYSFTYEGTPGVSGNVTGRLASVTLPTGGTISYSYSGGSNGINCADGSTATLTRATPDGTWTYAQVKGTGAASTTTVTDPQGNVTQIQFQGIYETQRVTYQGSIASGTLLQTVNTCYNVAASPCTGTAITLPITQKSVLNQLGASSGPESKHVYSFNAFGLPTETDDYDYGPGSPGALLRKLLITYAALGNNINAFQQTTTVQDGAGHTLAQTTNNYDEVTPTATSGTPQHVAVSGSRGNLTSTSQIVQATTSTSVTRHLTYYDTGEPNTSTDVNGAVTTYNYSSGSCGNSFPTSVSEPLNMSRSMAWNCTGGVLTSLTDENQQVTSTTYNDPFFWRPASTNSPDGGQTSLTYNSPTSITTTTKMNASQNMVSTTLFDGLGRTHETQLGDPEGTDYTDTTYDALGRLASVSNPYRSTSDPTYGITSYRYDALGRPTLVIPPDGSSTANNFSTSYSGATTTVTDQAGKKRSSMIDGLGRLIQVTEDPGGLGYVTTYGYDALSNLVSVVQNGSRQRTYSYDALARLTGETNPESGTVTYKYDSDSSCPSPYSFTGDLISRLDARGIRTCLQYDSLHRPTNKSYSNGTPGVALFYDMNNPFNHSVSNPIGRLVGEWTGNSGSWSSWKAFSYDSVGRLALRYDCLPKSPDCALYTTTMQYDLAGNLSSFAYPSGRVVKYTNSTAGRPTQVTFDNFNGTSVGYNYLSNVTYAPHGAPNSIPLGNGLTETWTYNKRLQPNNQQVASSILTPLYRSYSFYDASNHNNGDVMSVSDNLAPGRSQSFTYDSLNRIYAAQSSATSGVDCWAQQFGYDPWGNLLTATPTRSGCSMTALNIGVDANNHVTNSAFSYDAAGNTLADGSNTHVYDGAGRLSSVNSGAAVYNYDPDGQRVTKQLGSNTTQYIYSGTQPIAEYQPATGGWSDYIYSAGRLLARADTYEDRIHIFGTECSSCGSQYEQFTLGNIGNLAGHVVQQGDKLYLFQWQATGTRAGMNLHFSDGTETNGLVNDQDGNLIDADNVYQAWHYRRVDLSQFAGKTITEGRLIVEGYTQPGRWDAYYHDISVVAADGTVYPLYARQTSISLSTSGSSGMTGVGYEINHNGGAGAYPIVTTNYYHGDHLGSARLISSFNGYPVWSSTFLPYGQEWNQQPTINHYKFTSDERDSESNLDHTQFRQYSSQFGRWVSPDPAGLAAVDLSNPQSWNRYTYVINNPTRLVDPLGLYLLSDSSNGDGGFGGFGGFGFDPWFFCWLFCGGGGPPRSIAPPGGGGRNLCAGSTADTCVVVTADPLPPDSSAWDALKRAVSAVCRATPDAVSAGAGGDMGLFVAGSGQLNLTANGSSGELTLSLSMGLSGGVIGPDAYLAGSVTPSAPDNSFLNTHGQPSTSYVVGVGRVGYSGGGGTYGGTYGPSLLPVTAAVQVMLSKPLATVSYLGYLANPVRAACKGIGR